jgi:hypothetical protein
VAGLLQETLAEEKEADEKLTEVAGDVLAETEETAGREEEGGERKKGVATKSKAGGGLKGRAG